MYSIIIPVYNRPDEVDELLASLTSQTNKDFEVIVVEDGSKVPCKDVVDKYASELNVRYYAKTNSGPGMSRNYGVERAEGDYVLILDSDCVIPPGYIAAVNAELSANPCNAFGGPDRAHDSFTPVQKAISYSMTSFFTTGGIRGGKKKLDKFFPRSFNMGVRRTLYNQLNGFSRMRFGEDIDFSYRIVESGNPCRLFPEAWVWHKRRTDFRKFFKQVFNSGIARINLEKRHPGTMKLVHMLPMVFTVGVCMMVVLALAVAAFDISMSILPILPLLLYSAIILIDSTIQNRNLLVGILSVPAAFVQLMGYGFGFIKAWWLRCALGKDEFTAFEKNFYD